MKINGSDTADGSLDKSGWAPLVACSLGTFVLLAYTTVVTVSAPLINADLAGGSTGPQWIINSYTLALAALVLPAGALGDRFGPRTLLLVGLLLCGVATLGCTVSMNTQMLIAARSLQGAGGAAVLAAAIPVIVRCYRGAQRAQAFAVWGSLAAAGSTVGTVAGGVVVEFVSWRWLFGFGVLVITGALTCGVRGISREHGPGISATDPPPVDLPGSIAITLAMGGLTFTAINAAGAGWASVSTLTWGTASTLAMLIFAVLQRTSSHPLLPPAVFGNRRFLSVGLSAFAYYFAAFGVLPSCAAWLAALPGGSALGASITLAVQMIAYIPAALLLSPRLHTARLSLVLGGGTALTGLAALCGLAILTAPAWWGLSMMLVLSGFAAGLVSPIIPAAAASTVGAHHTGVAGAAVNSIRQLGLTLGVAVCSSLSATRAAGPATTPSGHLSRALLAAAAVGLVGGIASMRGLTIRAENTSA